MFLCKSWRINSVFIFGKKPERHNRGTISIFNNPLLKV
jgi:hypothetical protein